MKSNLTSKETINSILSIFEDIYHKPPVDYINKKRLEFTNKNMFKIKVKNMISCYEQILLYIDPKYIPFSFSRTPKESGIKEKSIKMDNLVEVVQTELKKFSKTEENSARNLENIYQVIGHLSSKIDVLANQAVNTDLHSALGMKNEEEKLNGLNNLFTVKMEEMSSMIQSELLNQYDLKKKFNSEIFSLKEMLFNLVEQQNQTTETILNKIEKDSKILEEMMSYVKGNEEIKDPNFSIETCLEQIQDTNMEIKEILINLDPSSMAKVRSLENSEFIKHPHIVQGQYINESNRSSSVLSRHSKTGDIKIKTPRIKLENSSYRESLEEKISKYITPKPENQKKKKRRTGSYSPAGQFKGKGLSSTLMNLKTDQLLDTKEEEDVNPNEPNHSPLGPVYKKKEIEKKGFGHKKGNAFRNFSLSNKNLEKAKNFLRNSRIRKRNRVGNSSIPSKKRRRKEVNKPPRNVVALVSPRISSALSSENSSFLAFSNIDTYIAVQRYTGTTTFIDGKTTHFSTIKSKFNF